MPCPYPELCHERRPETINRMNEDSRPTDIPKPKPIVRTTSVIEHCRRWGFPIYIPPRAPESGWVVCVLKDAIVFGEHFLILSRDELLIGGLVNNVKVFCEFGLKNFLETNWAFSDGRPSTAFLVGGSSNFGHFLVNYFSRLIYVNEFPELKTLPIITCASAPPNHNEILQLAGYGDERQIKIGPKQAVHFQELYVPTMLAGVNPKNDKFEFPTFLLDLIRGLALPNPGNAFVPAPTRRIYLSRKNARWRRVINEDEVLKVLNKFQFESVDPGEITFRQQIQFAQSSKIIVGPAGANMCLHWFAPPQTKIIQFLCDQRMNMTGKITNQLGQEYFEIIGPPLQTGDDAMCYDFSVP